MALPAHKSDTYLYHRHAKNLWRTWIYIHDLLQVTQMPDEIVSAAIVKLKHLGNEYQARLAQAGVTPDIRGYLLRSGSAITPLTCKLSTPLARVAAYTFVQYDTYLMGAITPHNEGTAFPRSAPGTKDSDISNSWYFSEQTRAILHDLMEDALHWQYAGVQDELCSNRIHNGFIPKIVSGLIWLYRNQEDRAAILPLLLKGFYDVYKAAVRAYPEQVNFITRHRLDSLPATNSTRVEIDFGSLNFWVLAKSAAELHSELLQGALAKRQSFDAYRFEKMLNQITNTLSKPLRRMVNDIRQHTSKKRKDQEKLRSAKKDATPELSPDRTVVAANTGQ